MNLTNNQLQLQIIPLNQLPIKSQYFQSELDSLKLQSLNEWIDNSPAQQSSESLNEIAELKAKLQMLELTQKLNKLNNNTMNLINRLYYYQKDYHHYLIILYVLIVLQVRVKNIILFLTLLILTYYQLIQYLYDDHNHLTRLGLLGFS